eukprot:gene1663-3214_t
MDVHPVSSVAIVLQRSPVYSYDQMKRLHIIDTTWAQWIDDTSAQNHMFVYAVIPSSVHADNFTTFKHIRHIKLLNSEQFPISPMINFLQTLLYVTCTPARSDWVVLANDHSFLIPQNLNCFIKSLDADVPVYTGNQLSLSYLQGTLYFASGGAGAIISHVSIKLFLITLILTKPNLISSLLTEIDQNMQINNNNNNNNNNSMSCTRRTMPKTDDYYGGTFLEFDVEGQWRQWRCVLRYLLLWRTKTVHTEGESPPPPNPPSPSTTTRLYLRLSRKTRLTLYKVSSSSSSSNSIEVKLSHVTDDDEISPSSSVPVHPIHGERRTRTRTTEGEGEGDQGVIVSLQQMSSCYVNSILLAHCLLNVYKVKFTSSRTTYGEERFNVYGPVRMLTGNVDDWYLDCKKYLTVEHASTVMSNNTDTDNTGSVIHHRQQPPHHHHHQQHQLHQEMSPPSLLGIPSLAADTISFHYVSSVEARLLYAILSRHMILDAERLFSLWPKTSADVGPYSMPLADRNESQLLFQFLYQKIKIFDRQCTRNVALI